jgi:hypothetical protein
MQSFRDSNYSRVVAGFVGLTAALFMTFGMAFATPVAQGATAEELQAQINSLLATISALQAQLSGSSSSSASGSCSLTFVENLKMGSTGQAVKDLQMFLNMDSATQVAASGAGSKGNETMGFGGLTKAAVIKFQNKYASEVLAPAGLTAGTGYWGSLSRAKAQALCGAMGSGSSSTGTGTGSTTSTPGSGLSVSSAAQPSAGLAPLGAARIPFTKVTFTASNDGDVTVSGVVVERVGQSVDAVLQDVVLLDENGTQVGVSKTLSSTHQATLSEPFVVKKGTSRTMTVAANRPSSGTAAHAGMVVGLNVVAVNTAAAVSGSMPIAGAMHTVNEGLTIGTVSLSRASTDPGAAQSKEVGQTGYTFSGIKVTAGSAEKIKINSIRWNQIGSASASDLKNLKTYVDGVAYDVTVSSDGKYFTTVFPGGLEVDKGFSKEIAIKGDINGGSGRTIAFDISKKTDLNVSGLLYGYGIVPPQTNSCGGSTGVSCFTSGEDPWWDGATVTVTAGTINVSTSNAVPAQNIAVNTNNVPLGAFTVDVRGESISVASLPFNIFVGDGSGEDGSDVTNIVLVDSNGTVVAGPVDGSDSDSSLTSSSSHGSFVFTDTVTFPVGTNTYTLKGKVSTDVETNDTIVASTTPTDWGTVRGLATGNTITPTPSSALTTNTMTVKAGSLSVSVSSVPIAQTIISGSQGFTFANYIFDASASGEDVRVTTIPLYYGASGTATNLTNCQLYDGATSKTSGSNVKNPTAVGSSTQFTFDGTGLVISKGSSKTLALKCNLSSGASGAYWWGLDSDQASSFTGVTGLDSGQTITETLTEANGQVMTSATGGSLTAVLDTNSPGYSIVSAGSTGVELARIKFSAANEDVNLRQVALQLSSVASNTPVDLVGRKVSLYDASNNQLVGEATFVSGDNATSSSITNFTVPKDGSKVMIVKGDIAGISNSGPLTASGDLLVVDYDGSNSGLNGNYGTGVSSGNTVTPSSSDTASQGVRVMKSYPVLSQVSLSSSEKLLQSGTRTLSKFKVTATGGDVALYKFSFSVSSSTVSATTTAYALYAFTDSGFSSADTTFSSTGLLNANNYFNGLGATTGATTQVTTVEIYPDRASATTTYIIGSGNSRWFELRATASLVETGTGSESIVVSLLGDAAFPVNASTLMQAASGVDGDTNDDFIWSPISTTTQNTINDLDFTNGYQVQGLPGTNMTAETLTSTN